MFPDMFTYRWADFMHDFSLWYRLGVPVGGVVKKVVWGFLVKDLGKGWVCVWVEDVTYESKTLRFNVNLWGGDV